MTSPILAFDDHAQLLVQRTAGPPPGLSNGEGWALAEVDPAFKWTLLL